MSRRSGQNGSIEQKGDSYFVRFWIDVPGQHRRKLKSVKIGDINTGAVKLKTEARKAIEESGANTAAHLEKVLTGGSQVTFKDQSTWWIKYLETRKKRPLKAHTLSTWKSHLTWLNEQIGRVRLADVNNKTAKELVSIMCETGFSSKTIHNYLHVVKSVVASAVNEDGDSIYPRKWNPEFIDLPEIEHQNTVSFASEQIDAIVEPAAAESVLYAFLAGSGLRIGEALALEVPSVREHFVIVKQSLWNATLQSPKTANGVREVDLPESLMKLLCKLIDGRKTGFVFQTSVGSPLHQSNLLRRKFHPLLDRLEFPRCGFHSFRRYRITHLRKNRVPEDLIRFWVGHANKNVTDLYSRMKDDREFRRQVVEQTGLGFTLPLYEVARNVLPPIDSTTPVTV